MIQNKPSPMSFLPLWNSAQLRELRELNKINSNQANLKSSSTEIIFYNVIRLACAD